MTHTRHRLWAYAIFAALLSAAGLPIYIHAPKFYVDAYGVSLTSLGGILFLLRMLDVVQDPVLGQLAGWLRRWRALSVALAVGVLALAMWGLFAVEPLFAPLIWFAVMLALVFSAFSYLTIVFYAQGVTKAGSLGTHGHLQTARWRETGALLGVCVAAVAPVMLGYWMDAPFTDFALGFAVLALVAALAMRPEWESGAVSLPVGFGPVMGDALARRLLVVAFLNAAPVAVTSTLFLFYVESRLGAADAAGPLLVLFFLAAAVSAPVWARLAERHGEKRVLLSAMALAVLAFACVLPLGTGDVLGFGVICVVTGFTLGADMTLLPALFARRMARVAPSASEGFGLWSFMTKFTLAFAAVSLLPVLEDSGFRPGAANGEEVLWLLTLAYAAVPCALKLVAMLLLSRLDLSRV